MESFHHKQRESMQIIFFLFYFSKQKYYLLTSESIDDKFSFEISGEKEEMVCF